MPARWPVSANDVSKFPRCPIESLSVSWAEAVGTIAAAVMAAQIARVMGLSILIFLSLGPLHTRHLMAGSAGEARASRTMGRGRKMRAELGDAFLPARDRQLLR